MCSGRVRNRSLQQFISHNVRADNANIASAWNAIYATINRANHIIAKVPNVTDPLLTDALKNQLTGEAYFVRALAYFDLARTWGGVQLALTPTDYQQPIKTASNAVH